MTKTKSIEKPEVSSYTPGPWDFHGPKIQKAFGDQTYWTIKPNPYLSRADGYKAVGFFYPCSDTTEDEQIANVKLIASAPRLLAENEILKKEIKALQDRLNNIVKMIKEITE